MAKVFSCEFCEISKNTFFTEHAWANASFFCETKINMKERESFIIAISILKHNSKSHHLVNDNLAITSNFSVQTVNNRMASMKTFRNYKHGLKWNQTCSNYQRQNRWYAHEKQLSGQNNFEKPRTKFPWCFEEKYMKQCLGSKRSNV